jgi:hypothetical protein
MDFLTYIEMLGFACCVLVYQLMPVLQAAAALALAVAGVRGIRLLGTALSRPQAAIPGRAVG